MANTYTDISADRFFNSNGSVNSSFHSLLSAKHTYPLFQAIWVKIQDYHVLDMLQTVMHDAFEHSEFEQLVGVLKSLYALYLNCNIPHEIQIVIQKTPEDMSRFFTEFLNDFDEIMEEYET